MDKNIYDLFDDRKFHKQEISNIKIKIKDLNKKVKIHNNKLNDIETKIITYLHKNDKIDSFKSKYGLHAIKTIIRKKSKKKKEKTNCIRELYQRMQDDDLNIDDLTEDELYEPFTGDSYELEILVDLDI